MKDSTRPLLILGTRTLAEELVDLVSEIEGYEVVGFVENMDPTRCQTPLLGLPVYWVDEIAELAATHWAVCGLATTFRSTYVQQVAACGVKFATLIHPAARVSAKSSLGEGTILSPGVIIASNTKLGPHVFVNRGVLIGHHTTIGSYTSILPGANIAGSCQIGEATYIGMGAVVIDHVTIGAHSIVGAGAVVTKDVPDNVLVVGVPAAIVKENIAGR